MEEDLIQIFKNISHIEKRLSVTNIGHEYAPLDYCITLSYYPEILSDLQAHQINLNKDFDFEMEEFGGIVKYKEENYIRRVNLNLSQEGIRYSSTKGLQFFYPSQRVNSNWDADSGNIDFDTGETFTEYFLLTDIYRKLINQLGDVFINYSVDYKISLTKTDLIFKIWPYDKNSIRL